ncbi:MULTISPECIES: uroporphyrinogen-III C-methyltransferase [unclassified Paenibacillus]|uniref:uroporphyrinogen-III C-methyltransferase n=1 Tax=unclassified Paenibacillus TaxID=185978 RepID=UPI00070A04AF|nr:MULTISPECIES: uroporphyrinogen-III C-methyltransferase [unclassified Paenibacillus]KQX49110.1 HemD protein [Paenibacillus sp. Root444D2]KRE48714.1 HemD protein [Paenibacillus sp. Soil724D2]
MNKGRVYLVGAGPGDPKLISVRGMEAIQKADVIVYDRLANPRLLKHRRPEAELIFVGKLPDKHILKQEEINQLLVDLALQGKVVTRLKGGDPSVFGRVGEEAELLADNDVIFDIIPGITSSIAVPAYAGIPVTHRDFTSSFAIITGHEYPNKTYSSLDWEHLAKAIGTMVFLMGVANLEQICRELIRCGKPPEMPVALVRWGTWADQQTITGTLADITEKVREANFKSPAVIIVGEVVKLREKLAWIEKKPLFGRRVLVTRARSQASELVDLIDDMGGEAVEFPVIRLQPPSRPEAIQALDLALDKLDEFDWVLLTSVNGVEYFFRRLREKGIDVRKMGKARIAAVGPKTAEALAERGIIADVLPAKYQGEGILEAIQADLKAGQKVLLPTADLARDYLPAKLKELGLEVTEVDVYENVLTTDDGDEIIHLLQNQSIHIITFTSSSTVTNLLEALRQLGVEEPLSLLQGVEIACIGPKTAETASQCGLPVTYMAEEATVASLVQSITQHK